MNLTELTYLSNSCSRSVCPENFTGAPGEGGKCPLAKGSAKDAARDLGTGWNL